MNTDCGQIKKQSEESGCDRLKRTLHFGMKMTDEVKFIFCVGYNSEHSKLQDLTSANLIINHFDELNAEKISQIDSFIK